MVTIGFFSKAFPGQCPTASSFCLEPPLYKGVPYHSAAKHEITAKISVSANFSTFPKVSPTKTSCYRPLA